MGSIKARKIKLHIPEEILKRDLELYKEKAVETLFLFKGMKR